MIETEDHGMSLIRNRRGFLGALFSALLALALLYPGASTAQEGKQIKLTEKHIQSFMGAYEDIAKLYDGADSDKPDDPKVEAQAAAVAKKNGFASLAQYDDVLTNITMIMSGIDPQTKKFTEPPEQIKKEIAALKADKSVPEADKKEDLAQLEAALKSAKPIQFKENIALVLKYFDQLAPFMPGTATRRLEIRKSPLGTAAGARGSLGKLGGPPVFSRRPDRKSVVRLPLGARSGRWILA
jgi:hypothetical protein